MALNDNEEFHTRFERLFEAAVDADAEDVEESKEPEGPTEIEVRS